MLTRKQAIAPELISFMSTVHSSHTLSIDTLGVYTTNKVTKSPIQQFCVRVELGATLE